MKPNYPFLIRILLINVKLINSQEPKKEKLKRYKLMIDDDDGTLADKQRPQPESDSNDVPPRRGRGQKM